MKVVIDACVLFPTVLRELVLGVADTGAFQPLWSARILEEWRRAALRHGERDGEIAGVEIALLSSRFLGASIKVQPETEARLTLPDPDDVHVFAAAVDGGADELLTVNTRDFPINALGAEDILRRQPDEFLLEHLTGDQTGVRAVVDTVLARAKSHGIDTTNRRALLKKARVPKFAKALDQG